MLTRTTSTWMDDQRKCHIDPKGPKQRHCSKQLQTYNLPTDDIENINCRNKGGVLLLANKLRTVLWGAERILQKIQKYSRVTLHRSTHPKTRRKNLAMTWIDSKKVHDRVSQSWIINCFKMYKISYEIINLIKKTLKTWIVELTAGGRSLADTKIQWRILK